jgi:hypothetical protein
MKASENGYSHSTARYIVPFTFERNTMQEQSKQIVMDAWQAFASRDAQRIGAFFAEDAEWIAPPGNATAIAMNHADHIIGREAIAHFIAKEVPKIFVADVSIDFRGFYGDGQTVVVEERMQATLFNGKKYDNDYCFIFELVDGKISQVREYMDTQRGKTCIFG